MPLSYLLTKEIYLVDLIENVELRSNLRCLNCIVFIRPTPSIISALASELAAPKYATYSICTLAYSSSSLI